MTGLIKNIIVRIVLTKVPKWYFGRKKKMKKLQVGDIIGWKPHATTNWKTFLLKIGAKQHHTHVAGYLGNDLIFEAVPKVGARISPPPRNIEIIPASTLKEAIRVGLVGERARGKG